MADSLMGPATGLVNSKLALADAGTENVLSGKKFYAGDKIIKTGSMPNNGAWSSTIDPGQTVQVPGGYHTGGGTVTARGLTANDVLGRIKVANANVGANVGSNRYILGIIYSDLRRYPGDGTNETGEWWNIGVSEDHHSFTGSGNGSGFITYMYVDV